MKKTTFTAVYESPREGDADNGKRFKWSYHRSKTAWILTDYDGYERTLAATWTDSIPLILQILSNHNMKPVNPQVFEIAKPESEEMQSLRTENDQLKAAAIKTLDVLSDCQAILDSVNRQVGGESHAVRIVLDRVREAIAAF